MSGHVNTLTDNRTLRFLLPLLGCALAALAVGVAIAKGGIAIAGLMMAMPPALFFAAWCFKQPKVGIFTCLILSFFLFSHSIGEIINKITGPSFQTGLILDGCLLVSLLGVLFSADRDDWGRLNNIVVYLLLVWFLYNVFELINPEAISREPWFTTVRTFSLYWIEITLIGLICLKRRNDLTQFVNIWMIGCFIQALWAFKQQYVGLTTEEEYWINTVAFSTHVINGLLRCFSLCPDAGQFGAVMAHATVFALVRMMDEPSKLRKVGYAVLGVTFFWGFAVAGSRGPLVIIAVGAVVYMVLKRNIVILVAGGLAGALAFGVLKYTSIGSNLTQVQRMRTALDPEDPSLQLRLYNQSLFKEFLKTRPFGVGLGLAGDSGKKYWKVVITQKGIDSWYVKIWVETGVVGLTYHIICLLIITVIGFRKVFRIRDPVLRSVMTGVLGGYVGILVANYGNQIMGQKPTCFIIYTSIVFFLQCHRFDTDPVLAEVPDPSSPMPNS